MAAAICSPRLAGRSAIHTAFSAWAAVHRPMARFRSRAGGAFHTRSADSVVAENTAGRIRLSAPLGRSVTGLPPSASWSGCGRTARRARVVAAKANPMVRAAPSSTCPGCRPSALRNSVAASRALSTASSISTIRRLQFRAGMGGEGAQFPVALLSGAISVIADCR